MDCTKTSPKRVYRRRQPEKSVLYRALAQHFESFLLLYEQRFEKSFGFLRAIVRDTVYRFLDCGILESGFAGARPQILRLRICGRTQLQSKMSVSELPQKA